MQDPNTHDYLATGGDSVTNTSGTNNIGTLTLLGAAGTQTVAGAVGTNAATGSLLAVNAGVTGGTSVFSGAIFAQTVNVSGAGVVDLNGGLTGTTLAYGVNTGTVALASGQNLSAGVTGTGAGNLTYAGGSQTQTGVINDSNLTVNAGVAGATTAFANNVTAATLALGAGTGTVTLSSGANLTAAVTGSAASTLSYLGGSQTQTGVINDSAMTINAGVAGATTSFANNVTAATLAFGAGTGTVSLANNANLTANVTATNAGTLTLAGASAITGTVGAVGNLVSTINAGAGTASVSGLVNATTLSFNGANTVSLNGVGTNHVGTVNFGSNAGTLSLADGANLTGNIDDTNTGTLTLVGTSTVTGNTGSGNNLTAVNAGANGKTDIFTGAIYATTVNVTGSGTVDINGGLFGSGTLAFGAGGGTVAVADAQNITGTVTTTANTSTLTLSGATTVSGTVGATGAGNNLLLIQAGANGKTDAFSGNVFASTTSVTGTGVVDFSGTATTNVNFAGDGTVNVASGKLLTGSLNSTGGTVGSGKGTVAFAGANSAVTTIGNTGILKDLTLSGSNTVVAASGAVLAADTMNLGNNTLTAATTFGMGTGGTQTLDSTVTSASVYGHVATTGHATVGTGTKVDLTLTAPTTTTTYTLVSGASGGAVGALGVGGLDINGTLDSGSARTVTIGLVTYSQVTTGTGAYELEIKATRNNVSTLGAGVTANDSSVDTALNTIGSSGDALLTTINGKVATAAGVSAAAVHTDLQSLTPTVDGSSEVAAENIVAQTQDITDGHLLALRDGDQSSGVAAGAAGNGVSMWAEGYGQHAKQDLTSGVNGYSSNTWGGAVGVDSSKILDKAIIGFALNYGQATANSDNANTTATNLGNYGLTLYGTYDLGQKMFVNGQAGYAYNTITTDRHNADLAGNTAHGSTSSDQFSAKVDAGRDYPQAGGLTLTPDVSAAYTYLNTAGYTETGAGGADNVVGSDSVNVFDLGVGATASWKFKAPDEASVKPSLHAGYAYDLVGDKVQTTSSFAGDPAATTFVTSGASPARSIFDLGAKVVYSTKANWDFSANYDFQGKQNYTSNTGEVRATAHF